MLTRVIPMGDPIHQIRQTPSKRQKSQEIVGAEAANELFFAVVGHVGSGTTTVAKLLKAALERNNAYDVRLLKAKAEIVEWARERDLSAPASAEARTIKETEELQDCGDKMRKEDGDHAAVARRLIRRVRSERAGAQGLEAPDEDTVIRPDGAPRAYILDSIRHPAEVHLLRSVYQNAFTLIGVVCDDETVKIQRLSKKYDDGGEGNVRKFMARDAKAPEKHGQRVADAFHLADFFIDNSEASQRDGSEASELTDAVEEQLERIVKLITHSKIERPTAAETAMYHAYGAMMRSACLSRQVGCALMDTDGNIIATGTNEVPRAGGGVYGAAFHTTAEDGASEIIDERCAFSAAGQHCRNTREQKQIVESLIQEILDAGVCSEKERSKLNTVLRSSRIGGLLEFSRAIHAEMDALLTAARSGVSPVGSRAFVTTFPCHYCARHLVSAGVDEVQYIEPYPKSLAQRLHDDAITNQSVGWKPPSCGGDKVLFRPFTGVAPRMYRRVFLKDRDYKNDDTGELDIGKPAWAHSSHLGRISYVELEANLSRQIRGDAPHG